ncbi:FtsX-like permease family protein [Halomarina pelagica]|uniref:FtsX-like permease family protein n=1 Tax=Halomarina pelagica TaxID=2961599 RepID=UPI0020C234A2|nr:FtsX-like permease family protein [Halomarina sp. BND7]
MPDPQREESHGFGRVEDVNYRRVLVTRWSRRDRLTVAVVAVTAAFLVGTIVLLTGVSSQTVALADQHGSSLVAEWDGSADDAVVLRFADARLGSGERVTVVGVPRGADVEGLPAPPPDGARGPTPAVTERRIAGEERTLTLTVRPRQGRTILSPRWYVTDVETAERLGVTRTLAVHPDDGGVPTDGVPLRGALAFFVVGARQLLAPLSVAAAGGAVIVGVLVHSVTRMSVRDRRDDLHALYATGASPDSLARLFALRAGLLAAVGGALGYAVGVVVPHAIVNAAVAMGYPVALDLAIGPLAALLVAGLLAAIALVGTAVGYLAARSVLRGTLREREGTGLAGRLPDAIEPTVLSPRAFVPTAASLTVFVVFVVLVGTIGGTVTAVGATGGTITEPGAIHPVASQLDQRYATTLRENGIEASPEVLLFAMIDGRPVFGRGVNFTAFSRLSDGRLVRGEPPSGPGEAVVGEALAERLGVRVGESILLGGSTATGVTTVTVSGIYEGDGIADDQLYVSLETARYLRDLPAGTVNLIRVGSDPTAALDRGGGVVVLDVGTPERVAANGTIPVTLSVRNLGSESATRAVTVRAGPVGRTTTVTLSPGERTTARTTLPAPPPGTWNVTAGERRSRVAVVEADAPRFAGVPERVPPGSTFSVGVRRGVSSRPANATVSLGGNRTTTGADGTAILRAPNREGRYRLVARAGGERTVRPVTVDANATRDLLASLRLPDSVGVGRSATARVALVNPWGEPLSRTVRVVGPGGTRTREVRLGPHERTTLSVPLSRRPPGTYEVGVAIDGRGAVAEERYAVTGDRRLTGALVSSGYSAGAAAGGIVERSFGNLWAVLGAIVAQGAFMSVGSTAAAFAGAVHARRRSIGVHRATGMAPRRLFALAMRDALVLALPASLLAVGLGTAAVIAATEAGALTAFGVAFSVAANPVVLGATAGAALALALGSAAGVVLRFASESPADLLRGERR